MLRGDDSLRSCLCEAAPVPQCCTMCTPLPCPRTAGSRVLAPPLLPVGLHTPATRSTVAISACKRPLQFPEVCVANVFSGYLPLCFVENIFLKIDFRTILDLQKNLNDSPEISHPPQTQLPLLLTPVSVVHWLQLINQEMSSLTIVRTAFRFPAFT